MTNKEKYMKEINTNKEFKITIKEFINFLNENNDKFFWKELIEAKTEEDLFSLAWDYTIPYIMVSYLKRA